MKKRMYLFIAHGSREDSARMGFETLLSSFRRKFAPHDVGGAYLTLNDPSISVAIEAAIQKKHDDFVVIPLFFFEGNHLKNDIPTILADIKLKNPQIDFQVMPPIASIEGFSDWVIKSISKQKKS